jgi:hypothetical protein
MLSARNRGHEHQRDGASEQCVVPHLRNTPVALKVLTNTLITRSIIRG